MAFPLHSSCHFLKQCRSSAASALIQVAHYNDKYIPHSKKRPDHVNQKRKTKRIKDLLKDIEPTAHDLALDDALRFSESEFRAQLLHLRGEWGKMYKARETSKHEAREKKYNTLEGERKQFIESLMRQQSRKRKGLESVPVHDLQKGNVSLEDDFRRARISSPEVEVEQLLREQEEGSLFTPNNFESAIEGILTQREDVFEEDVVLKSPEDTMRKFAVHNIEFLVGEHQPGLTEISDSAE